jgi:hypothetical protein
MAKVWRETEAGAASLNGVARGWPGRVHPQFGHKLGREATPGRRFLLISSEGKMDAEMKKWIDESSYEALLSRWRFAPVGSPWFIGEIGQYYSEVMAKKREEIGPYDAARASKNVGLDR